MKFIDYYKILGIDKTTDQKDVKKAYLKRAKQFHPDLHPDDPKAKAKFQALNEAYEVIGDPEKRRKYDQYGEHWRDAEAYEQATGGRGGFSHGGGFNFTSQGFGDINSIINDILKRRGGRASGFSSSAPRDTEASLDIDLYTALLGGTVLLTLGSGETLRLKVKPGTQPGSKLRFRGKGTGGGNLIVTLNVTLPTALTPRQQELLRQLQAEGTR